METIEEVIEQTESEADKHLAAQVHLQAQADSLNRYRDNIDRLLDFIAENREKLDGTYWTVGHVFCELDFNPDFSPKTTARAIVHRWPGRVWIKKANPHACGSVDYVSVDKQGVSMRIANAEQKVWQDAGKVVGLENVVET